MNFKRKESKLKKIFMSQSIFFIVGILLLAGISYPLSKKIFQNYRLNKEVEELNQEIKKMESHNKELKGLISYLDSKSFTEEDARLNLNLKKPGEEVVVIKKSGDSEPDNSPSLAVAKYEKENNVKKEPNPVLWWRYFFKVNL